MSTGTARIEARFAKLRDEGRAALVTYVMSGDPDLETSAKILAGLPSAGADIIEIGMAFTDPMADGPSIQVAGLRALKAGIVGFAGLDVLPTEPPEPPPSLLVSWRDDEDWIKGRLIVTPHAAFYSEESDRDMRIKASTTVLEVLNGQNPRNRVN